LAQVVDRRQRLVANFEGTGLPQKNWAIFVEAQLREGSKRKITLFILRIDITGRIPIL